MKRAGTPGAQARRLLFIDRLRGWAVLVMIEVHVVNALLQPGLRHSDLFVCLNFINGIVAPAFVFCAGFAFALSAMSKWEQYIHPTPVFLKYAKRLGFIFLVAYSLHVPFFSLRKMLAQTDPDIWTTFFQSDVLQTIAASLTILLILVPLTRSKKWYGPVVAVVGACIVFLSPLVAVSYFPNTPIWLRAYLSVRYDSGFPLFPWGAFALFGAASGILYTQSLTLHRRIIVRVASLISLIVGIVAIGIYYLPVSIYPPPNFWFASPEFFFLRLAILLGLCALLLRFEPEALPKPGGSLFSSPILLFGRESMLVYVAHLLVVYGNKVSLSYAQFFGATLDYTRCCALFIILAVAMYILATAWDWVKNWNPDLARIFQYAFICICVGVFCYREY